MKIALLAAAAAAVLLGAGWFLLRPDGPAAPPPGGLEGPEALPAAGSPESHPAAAPPVAPPPPPPPAGEPDRPAPSPPHRPPPGDQESLREPAPPLPPPGESGEVVRTGLPKADQEKVDEVRRRMAETRLGDVDWRRTGLRDAVALLAEKSGIPIEVAEDVPADATAGYRGPGENALELLRSVANLKGLHFEVLPEKVVVRR